MNLKTELIRKRRPGATLAGMLSVALSSVLLLCGAGLTPTGTVQTADINANGHNLTNAASITAANLAATNSLTVPSNFFATNNVVQTSGSYANPSWLTLLAWSKVSGTPTTINGYGITNAEPALGNPATNGFVLSSTTSGTRLWIAEGGGGGAVAWELKSANFTAVAGHKYQIDSSGGAVTVTLPASATAMDAIEFADGKLSWNTHNVTLGHDGLNVNGAASDYTASVQGNKLNCVYISSGYGWSVK